MLGRAEAQEIERRDRPRAHGEDVAQNAAHSGRRALIGLDERGVVVRLHLEDADLAVADVDDAGVLAGPVDDLRALGRQLAQMQARRLVGAMLVPHRRDDAELGEGGRAADEGDEARIFVGFEPMRDGELFVDLGFGFGQRPSAFSLRGDAWPLALRRDDLKSSGQDRATFQRSPMRASPTAGRSMASWPRCVARRQSRFVSGRCKGSLFLGQVGNLAKLMDCNPDRHAEVILRLAEPRTREGNRLCRIARDRDRDQVIARGDAVGRVVMHPSGAGRNACTRASVAPEPVMPVAPPSRAAS